MLPFQPGASFQVQETVGCLSFSGSGVQGSKGRGGSRMPGGRKQSDDWWAGLGQREEPAAKSDRGRGRGTGETGSKDPEADLEGPTDLHTHNTRERGARGGEGKGWTNGGEENEERHRVNQRWSQKSQVTEAEANAQRKKSAGTGRRENSKTLVAEIGERTAAAAKSLQSCPTLCDPIDGSPPGSPVPGILQARTLEWVAISFSNA